MYACAASAQRGQQQDAVGNAFGAGKMHCSGGPNQWRNIQILNIEHQPTLYLFALDGEDIRQLARVSLAFSIIASSPSALLVAISCSSALKFC